jgi:hypothetical protein
MNKNLYQLVTLGKAQYDAMPQKERAATEYSAGYKAAILGIFKSLPRHASLSFAAGFRKGQLEKGACND